MTNMVVARVRLLIFLLFFNLLTIGCAASTNSLEKPNQGKSELLASDVEKIALTHLGLERSSNLEISTQRVEGGWQVQIEARRGEEVVFNVVSIRNDGIVTDVFRSL